MALKYTLVPHECSHGELRQLAKSYTNFKSVVNKGQTPQILFWVFWLKITVAGVEIFYNSLLGLVCFLIMFCILVVRLKLLSFLCFYLSGAVNTIFGEALSYKDREWSTTIPYNYVLIILIYLLLKSTQEETLNEVMDRKIWCFLLKRNNEWIICFHRYEYWFHKIKLFLGCTDTGHRSCDAIVM